MVLTYIELADDKIRKSSFEVAYYASELAKKLTLQSLALVIGNANEEQLEELGNYGISKVFVVSVEQNTFQNYADVIYQVASKINSQTIVFPKSISADAYAAELAIKLQANIISNILELPNITDGFKVKRSIYSGKAYEIVSYKSENKILVVKKNAINPIVTTEKAAIEKFDYAERKATEGYTIKETIKASDDILLTDAEIVIGAGRGMKGPENWYLIENLAKVFHAATACSKPVSDIGWRPHHEHVGQTGIKISPSIYFAVGISGAIQHLAGVNSSKTIVVINKDADAPFFKAADYGIVGDAFEILPKLTEAAKNVFS